MPLPANVSTGTVVARFIDSSGAAAAGTVTFMPSPSLIKNVTASPAPTSILPKPVTATLDINGAISVVLVATDDPDNNPVDWTYEASFNLTGLRLAPFSFGVPSDSTVDLSVVAPVSSANGATIIARGVPAGGAAGQMLVKASGTNYDLEYADAPGGAWGSIDGTLTDQADLIEAIDAAQGAAEETAAAALTAALADTTNIHGIADTSVLVTDSELAGAISGLAPVAASGDYADLTGEPTLPVSRDATKAAATEFTGTVLAADPDLTIALPVGTFDFECLAFYDGTVNNDAKFQLNFSGTATVGAAVHYARAAAAPTTTTNAAWDNGTHAVGAMTGWGGTFSSAGAAGAGIALPFRIHGRIIVTVAGNLSLSAAKQNNTDTGGGANATRTLPFSYISAVERVTTP